MSQALPSPIDCCSPCPVTTAVPLPGIPGPPGPPCVPCVNGIDAFTLVANYAPNPQPQMPYPIQVLSSTLTIGFPTVALVSTATLVPGMDVSGTGISGGTTILSVDSPIQITLTTNATVGGVQSITYKQSVTVNTTSSTGFLTPGEIAFVQSWGYMLVISLPSATSVRIQNIADGSNHYIPNVAQGTILAAANKIVPGGLQGIDGILIGAAGGDLTGTYPNPVIGAGKVTTAKMTATGVGAITRGDALNVAQVTTDVSGRITAMVNVPIAGVVPGGGAGGDLTGTYPSPTLVTTAVVAGTYGGSTTIPQFTVDAKGRLIAASNAVTKFLPRYGLLGVVIGVNLNVGATDTPIPISSVNYIVRRVIGVNASISLTVATAGVFNTAGGVGAICADQVLSALTAASKYKDLTVAGVGLTDVQTPVQLFLRCGTPQGAAATADFYVFGEKLD